MMARILISLCYVWIMTRLQGCDGTEGKKFVVMFPYSPRSEYSFFVTLVGQDTAQISSSTPRNTSLFCETMFLGGDESSKQIVVNSSFAMTSSGVHPSSAILIQADRDVTVHAVSSFVKGLNTDDKGVSSYAFTVLPIQQLSTYYVTITSCQRNHCFIAIGSPYQSTSVTVTLRMGEGMINSLSYRGTQYTNGSHIVETLNEFEAMYIRSIRLDLSGTRVSATKPVAVISGGEFEHIGNGTRKDAIVEQIPPVDSLGKVFVLVPFPVSTTYTVVFVVFTQWGTRLHYDSNKLETVTKDDFKQVLHLTSPTTLISSENILVCLLPPSETKKKSRSDPSLTLAMPARAWTSSFSLSCGMNTGVKSTDVYLVIYTQKGCDALQLVSDRSAWQPKDLSWTDTGDFQVTHLVLSPSVKGRLTVSADTCTFGGYLNGAGNALGWTYVLGWDAVQLDNTTDSSDYSRQKHWCEQTEQTTGLSSNHAKTELTVPTLGIGESFKTSTTFGIELISSTSSILSFDNLTYSSTMSDTPSVLPTFTARHSNLSPAMSQQTDVIQDSDVIPHTRSPFLDDTSEVYTNLFQSCTDMSTTTVYGNSEMVTSLYSYVEIIAPTSSMDLMGESISLSSFLPNIDIVENMSRNVLSETNTPRFTLTTRPPMESSLERASGIMLSTSAMNEMVTLSEPYRLTTDLNSYFSDNAGLSLKTILDEISNSGPNIHPTSSPLINSIEQPRSTVSTDRYFSDGAGLSMEIFSDEISHSDLSIYPTSLSIIDGIGQSSSTVLTDSIPTPEPTLQPEILKLCPCSCKNAKMGRAINMSDPKAHEQLKEEIKKELHIDKTDLSSTIRSKTSADSKEVSHQYLGSFLAISVCFFVTGLIVVPDIIELCRYIYKLRKPIMVENIPPLSVWQ